jgi:hypothetical protein
MVRRLGQARLTELRAAFNAFSRMVAVQSIAVTDSAVRQRVRRHVELLARVVTLAESSRTRRFPWMTRLACSSGGRWRRGKADRMVPPPSGRPVAVAVVTSGPGVLVGRRRDGNPPWPRSSNLAL